MVLGWKESMGKKQIKLEMERDHKYVTCKRHAWGDGGQMTYIVQNPKTYIKHLTRFDFKNYKEDAIDWGEWMGGDVDSDDDGLG